MVWSVSYFLYTDIIVVKQVSVLLIKGATLAFGIVDIHNNINMTRTRTTPISNALSLVLAHCSN